MRSLASFILASCCVAAAAAQQLDASTPIIEFVTPTRRDLATCRNATFRWLTRLEPESEAATALFTLVLDPVDSGDPRPTTSIPGEQPTSASLTGSAPSASSGTPGRRKRQTLSAVAVRHGLLAPQGVYSLTSLPVPPGWYILGGSDVTPADAGLVFLPSQPFQVHSGSSTECLDEFKMGTVAPAPATPSASPEADSERVHVTSSRQHAAIIAGAVLGGFFFAALVLGGFWYFRNKRRRSVEQWRDVRAAQWAAFAAKQPSSSTGHGDDEKDPEREAKAREIAAMLREAGIREGAPRPTLRREQFELPGLRHGAGSP
ncbi:hypothetical protein AURDEDRAFT_179765 [Auricularia subglabra TFB-10046 SS5]|nr:hypothetical protein AURDEDRAFT_179765 [Auricularia subglabra TFB-10046 SS5]